MARPKIELPAAWYDAAPRADLQELQRVQAFHDLLDQPGDIDRDWRWCSAPMTVLGSHIGTDLRDFVENDKDYTICEDDIEFQHQRCREIEAEMREVGVEAWFRSNPVAFAIEGDGSINFYVTGIHGVGVAFHTFGADCFPALVSPDGSTRFLPVDRAPEWRKPASWSLHVVDDAGARFEDDLAVAGAAAKTVFSEIIGGNEGYAKPQTVKAWLREAQAFDLDLLLDQQHEEYQGERAARRVKQLEAAADQVVVLLRRAVEIGGGVVVGADAAKFKWSAK